MTRTTNQILIDYLEQQYLDFCQIDKSNDARKFIDYLKKVCYTKNK